MSLIKTIKISDNEAQSSLKKAAELLNKELEEYESNSAGKSKKKHPG